jgi:hypothetical protein
MKASSPSNRTEMLGSGTVLLRSGIHVAGEPVQLTNGLGEWHAHKGQWSPDGKTIIYTRDADQGNIFTIDNYK